MISTNNLENIENDKNKYFKQWNKERSKTRTDISMIEKFVIAEGDKVGSRISNFALGQVCKHNLFK